MKNFIGRKAKQKNAYSKCIHSQGFSIIEVVAVIAGLMLLFLVNSRTMLVHINSINRTQRMLDAEMLQLSVGELVVDPSFVVRILQTKLLDDGTAVNDGSNNKGIRCIRDTLYGANTLKCVNKKIPDSPAAPCDTFVSTSASKLCWIQNNLSDHRVDIVPHPDPTKNTLSDLVIDSRPAFDMGVSSRFQVCSGFSLDPKDGNGVTCPFRLGMYVWVECDGGQPFCGGGTGFGGKIRFAMIPEPHGAVKLLGIHNYSILDWEIGAL